MIRIERTQPAPYGEETTAASWHAFDGKEFIGHCHNIAASQYRAAVIVFQPVPDALGYTRSDLEDFQKAIKLAAIDWVVMSQESKEANDDDRHSTIDKFADPACNGAAVIGLSPIAQAMGPVRDMVGNSAPPRSEPVPVAMAEAGAGFQDLDAAVRDARRS